MRYQQSYRALFDSTHWPTTLLAGSLSMLVPPFGPGLFAGYLHEVAEAAAQPEGKPPDFDMGRVGDYLGRGLRPTLIRLLFFAPVLVLFGLLCGAVVLNTNMLKGPTVSGKLLTTAALAGIVAAGVIVSWLLAPVTIHLALRPAPAPSSAVAFVFDFFRLLGKEAMLAQLFVWVTGLSLLVIGLLMCGFGVPTALALTGYSQYHLLGQLHRLYLQRAAGGEPASADRALGTSGFPA